MFFNKPIKRAFRVKKMDEGRFVVFRRDFGRWIPVCRRCHSSDDFSLETKNGFVRIFKSKEDARGYIHLVFYQKRERARLERDARAVGIQL